MHRLEVKIERCEALTTQMPKEHGSPAVSFAPTKFLFCYQEDGFYLIQDDVLISLQDNDAITLQDWQISVLRHNEPDIAQAIIPAETPLEAPIEIPSDPIIAFQHQENDPLDFLFYPADTRYLCGENLQKPLFSLPKKTMSATALLNQHFPIPCLLAEEYKPTVIEDEKETQDFNAFDKGDILRDLGIPGYNKNAQVNWLPVHLDKPIAYRNT